MGQPTLIKLMAICLISTTVPSTMALSSALDAAEAIGLLPRQSNSCSVSGYTPCNQGLPSNFCCAPNTSCVAFNGGASAICCPAGHECTNIQPINNCDNTQLNATLFPLNPVHSTDLVNNLFSCGSKTCCPAGYSCQNNQCFMNNQTSASSTISASSLAPTSTLTPNKASSTATPASTSPSSSTSHSATTIVPVAESRTHCNSFPVEAVLVGFFPGFLVGALLATLIIICLGRQNQRKEHRRQSGDLGSVTAHVSDPIYQDAGATRTDFLRRASKSRARSLFSRSPTLRQHNSSDGLFKRPQTPESRTGSREPSMEIKVYSPPDGRLGRQTTFTEMMEEAKLRADEPYLGNLGRVDPRSRDLTGASRDLTGSL